MKKYIIIGLIVLVGGAMIIVPMLKKDIPEEVYVAPAVFDFPENLQMRCDEVAPLKITVNEGLSKLELYFNDSLLMTWNDVSKDVEYKLNGQTFGIGARYVVLVATRKDGSELEDRRLVRVVSDITPEYLFAAVVKDYPHEKTRFTQGLEFYKGQLYEGTGDPSSIGATYVGEVNLNTSAWGKKMGLDATHFGEGITILDDKLYQLTYKNGKCYTYSLDFTGITGQFLYTGEGWGLCNDGAKLIMSNGTEELYFRDPETFSIIRTLQVYDDKGPIINLNELEFIDGKIYANVWTTDTVVVIDPATGKVLQRIDASQLASKGRAGGEALNGIAHNPLTGKTYMTGKYWPSLFEVQFVKEMPLP